MNLLSRLRRTFSARSNVIQTRAGAAGLPGAAARSHWIVGRALCMYRREDFSAVPRSKRRAALELRLPMWSPFERTGHHCVWSGGSAMVWFWDEDEIGPGTVPAPPPSGRRARARGRAPDRILPETVFYPRKRDGVHLQACREGHEAPALAGGGARGRLLVSRAPDEHEIGWFLDRQESAAPAAAPASPPLLSDSGIAPDPWRVSRTAGEWFEANERALVSAALLALALTVVWQEARFWKLRHVEEEATAAFGRMQDELGPLLAARNEFIRQRRTNLALKALLHEPSQAHLMALVDRGPPERGGRVPRMALPAARAPPRRDRPRPGPHRLRPRPGVRAPLRAGQGRARPRRGPGSRSP